MKYFEIQDSPELKYAPQLKDWYGKFDVRDIRIDTFPKLPDMQLFINVSGALLFSKSYIAGSEEPGIKALLFAGVR